MEDTFCWTGLIEVQNGLVSPLYSEGQRVQAADLTLDRGAHDQDLWRLRRFLHGWGIVAGLAVELGADQLSIGAGYGICPSGAELYLPEEIILTDLGQRMETACGPGSAGCALTPTAVASAGPLEVWLVAAPMLSHTAPRPAWPKDCDHPGNHLAPTRACGGVRLGFACSAPPRHAPDPQDCARLREILCRGGDIALPRTHPAPDLLVLAKLRGTGTGAGVTLDLSMRRRLLPVAVLQDFVLACGCQTTGDIGAHEDITDPITEDPETPTLPTTPAERPKGKIDWTDVREALKSRRLAQERAKIRPDKGDPVMSLAEAMAFAKAGLSVDQVLTAEKSALAEQTGIAEARLDQLRANLADVQQRLDQPGF